MNHKTDVIIIGAGPIGLFAVFELGLLNVQCHVVDNLDKVGGQCSELYPEKPIYDIPSRPHILAQELTDDLMKQAKPFNPVFHLGQQAEKIEKKEDDLWQLTTSNGVVILAKCIVIAAGAGSFVPRKPPIKNIEKFENKSVQQSEGQGIYSPQGRARHRSGSSASQQSKNIFFPKLDCSISEISMVRILE